MEKLEGGPGGPGGPPTEGQDQYLPRDQLKITLKVFLHEATVSSLYCTVLYYNSILCCAVLYCTVLCLLY